MSDVQPIVVGLVQGLLGSAVFILVLFIGFCTAFGFFKTKQSSGHGHVVKSLDEAVDHQPVVYFPASTPHGPIDQLKGATLKHSV